MGDVLANNLRTADCDSEIVFFVVYRHFVSIGLIFNILQSDDNCGGDDTDSW